MNSSGVDFRVKSRLTYPQPKMELRRLEDVYCDKYIVSVDLVEHGTVLAVSHDDSSITCYDTRTMTVLNGLDDSTTVTCLAQAGFQYPLETSGMPGTDRSCFQRHD